MFMASNQFKAAKGHEEAFESSWAIKQSSFQSAPGFIACRFVKWRETGAISTYVSVTMWENEESFLAWCYGRGADREWIDVSRPAPNRMTDLDTLIPSNNPQ